MMHSPSWDRCGRGGNEAEDRAGKDMLWFSRNGCGEMVVRVRGRREGREENVRSG